MSVCAGCGAELPPSLSNRPRKWCTERCRKRTLYTVPCVDCGGPTGYGTTQRCTECDLQHRTDTRYWTEEKIVSLLRVWAEQLGRLPTADQGQLRSALVPTSIVQERFGSWNAGIAAAGFIPRRTGRPKAA